MKKENIPSEIFDWLASKDYTDLSKEEKNLVDSIMTQKEYNGLKNTVSYFLEVDKKITIKERPFSVPQKKVPFLARAANYPIPAYQVAACLMALVGLFLLMKPNMKTQNTTSTDSLVTDTTGISVANDVYPDSLVFKL